MAGLASVYSPECTITSKLLALQQQARASKHGMSSTFEDYDVVKTKNGSAFHRRDCPHLSTARNLLSMKASEATDIGLHPYRTCLADRRELLLVCLCCFHVYIEYKCRASCISYA